MKKTSILILFALLVFAPKVWAQFSGGDGTQANPYRIASSVDWNTLASNVNAGNTYSGVYFKVTDVISPASSMIGNSEENSFQGIFDGNGQKIVVSINGQSNDYAAPFRYVKNATFKRVYVDSNQTTLVSSSGHYAGGLVGHSSGNTHISNCELIINVVAVANGELYHGGVVGCVADGVTTIDNCLYNGGFFGNNVTHCGGFVGWVEGNNDARVILNNCLFNPKQVAWGNTGSCTFARSQYDSDVTLNNCYYTETLGTAQGISSAEGVNLGSGWMSNSTPDMSANNLATATITGLPFFYDYTGSAITVSYAVANADGSSLTEGTHYTAVIKDESGMEVTEVVAKGTYTLTITGTSNYIGEKSATFHVGKLTGGTGTATDPYLIYSQADWNEFAANVNSGTTYSGQFFKLTADITVTETISSGTPTKMVGTSDSNSFQGTFDGNGHTIRINYSDTRNADFCAPFRYINGATIKYLHVDGTIYKTKGKNAGGLVGKAVGNNTIDNCRSSVDIHFNKDGDVSSGGFIGELRESGGTTFNNCLFDGKLRGAKAYKWGGFVGWVASKRTVTFNNCFFNPAQINFDINDGSDNSKTFARHDGTVVVNNCYYKTLIKDAQGATNTNNMNNEQLLAALGGGWETVSESNVEKVVPIMAVHPLTGDGSTDSPYEIASVDDWNNFACNVFLGMDYEGAHFKLTHDISITRMVGYDMNHTFKGIFDGDGHTITVTLSSSADWCAPFAYTYGATILNLATEGTINTSARYAGGVVGRNGTGRLMMTNVTSNVTINSTHSGEAYHGGLVGYTLNATLTGCSFTGELLGTSSTHCGGLMGWKTNTANTSADFYDCFFAPTQVTVSTTGSKTLVVNNGTANFTNCYYTETLGTAQGTLVHSITPGNYVTMANAGNATAEYDVSGITCYNNATMLNNVFYASNGSAVSLNLSYTLPEGCEFSGYQISAGTLEGSPNPYTLTMPNEDVIVNVIANFSPWQGEGTAASPYLISNASHWDMLAVGVNSGDTYSGKYFRLTDDISVTSMVGSADHKFCGHFDGYDKTLTVSYNTNEQCTAPFRYIEGAEISNLHITGTITTSAKFAGGFVAHAQGNNTMTNCRSSVTINSMVSGDGSHGGFVAYNTGGTFTMEGCTFNGSMLGSSTNNCGGFVGWNETNGSPSGTVIFRSCFLVPTSITVGIEHTYARSRTNDGAHVQMYYSNCRTNFGDNQEFRAYSISAGDDVTVEANVSVANTYTVSGITIYNVGMMYDGVLYARENQSMSLNLSYTGAGSATGFGTTAGSLNGDSSPFTLTMGTADAVINAINGSGSGWTHGGSGTSESPYLISNSDEWDEFADKVNNGIFGFNTAYYKLAADISVTTMVGTDGHKFKGHFDGDGKTLTLSYGSAGSPFSEDYCAPFRYIEGADIHNLIVDGNIYTNHQFAAGIAGYALNNNAITDCRSSVTINSSVSGDGTHGGFVANCQNYTDGATFVTFTRCAFNGHLLGSATSECGGFVGWAAGNDWAGVKFIDCIFAPSEVSILTDGSATFSRRSNSSDFITVTVENSYYTQSFGIRQGEMAYVTQPADVTTEAMTIVGVTVYVKKTLVTNVAATEITPNTANISWTGSNTCSNYQVRYRVKPNADIYSTDFEDGLPDGWTMFDNDDDEHNWTYDDGTKKGMAHSGKGCMYSASYINNYGALEPDNWLVSPQLTLGGTMKVWLKGQDEDEYGEHFAIYLSLAGNSKADFLDANGNLLSTVITLVPETETTNEYQEYTADLSAYNGEGYISIRHFNCYDEFYLVVDDFCLYDDNAGDEWTVVSGASPDGTTLEGLTASTTYEYQVGYDYSGNTYYTTTATLTTLAEDVAPTDLSVTAITANIATLSWTGYGDSYNLRYSEGGVAKVTLSVPNDIWDDGSGYQMLLDADHDTYGSVIPESGGLTSSGDASPETYANFEYKIPENADGAMSNSNVVDGTEGNQSVTITIVAGIYDWCITNPSPNDRIWIASQNGNIGGRQNDFTFEAGKHYTFTITLDEGSGNDCVNMTVEDDETLASGDVTTVTGITSTSYTLNSLTASTSYTVYVQSVKGDKTSEWSSIHFTTLDEDAMALYVKGYGDSDDGYVLLASPVGTVNPEDVAHMLDNNYDLYAFEQNPSDDKEWRNYKVNAFNLEAGKGYLYANSKDVALVFPGTPYNSDGVVTLSKTSENGWSGWNLVGNPFYETAYIEGGRSFYTMNADGSEIIVSASNSIEAMEGIFVVANEDGETITFTTSEPANNGKGIVLNLSLANRGGVSTGSTTAVIDRAIVRFGESGLLPKFQMSSNSTKVYIQKDNKDYAVVNAETQGEMPVSFKAKESGTYTLSLGTEEVAFNYLHLIDNLTGNDVDLLQTPNYSFEAKTTDYASRFKLVFATKDGPSTDSETFAFYSNGSWIISNEGEATLQVIDVNGRILSSETVNGSVSKAINAAPGVYMIRLINGTNVKMQKIVIR